MLKHNTSFLARAPFYSTEEFVEPCAHTAQLTVKQGSNWKNLKRSILTGI